MLVSGLEAGGEGLSFRHLPGPYISSTLVSLIVEKSCQNTNMPGIQHINFVCMSSDTRARTNLELKQPPDGCVEQLPKEDPLLGVHDLVVAGVQGAQHPHILQVEVGDALEGNLSVLMKHDVVDVSCVNAHSEPFLGVRRICCSPRPGLP